MKLQNRNTSTGPARIDFRLDPDAKRLIERAAAASGQTVSDYAVSTLIRNAHDVLDRQTLRRLSDRDRDLFLDLIDRDDLPNDALKRAARRFKRTMAR